MSNKGDDYVRPPDKTSKMRLVDDSSPNDIFENDEDFLRYKFLIMHNTKIPNEMKSAMIASKRDEMVRMRGLGHVFSGGTFNPFEDFHRTENQYANSKSFSHGFDYRDDDIDDITFQPPVKSKSMTIPTQTISRNDAYTTLVELIFAYYDDFNSYCNVEGLVMSIQQYLDNTIDEIILQSDVCWGIRQNIELLCQEDTETKNALKKIFIPDSIDEYEKFVEMINVQKQSNDIKDLEEINKQIQLQHELEEQENLKKINKQKEIEKRNILMNNLFQQLTRLGSYDNSVKELKIQVTPAIEQYIAIETDQVIVTPETYESLIKFIKQIRLDSILKEELINTFQYI